jgi:hypothetical protein
MKVAVPSLANLKPNPDWASLPLFDRTGWKRVRFGEMVENCADTTERKKRRLRPRHRGPRRGLGPRASRRRADRGGRR